MHDTLRFWLDRGVDGFRMDVVQSLVKRADFADLDDPNEILYGDAHLDPAATHALLRDIRRLLDGYPGDRVAVGETSLLSTAQDGGLLRRRRRAAPVLQLPPDPGAVGRRARGAGASAAPTRRSIPRGAWPTWVLSNHDVPRHRTRYGGSEAAARAAVVHGPHAAGHALPLRGRGAGPARRGGPPGAQARPDRPRRLPGPDAVDAAPSPTAGARRALAALPARARRALGRGRARRPRSRCCTSTGDSWPMRHALARRCASARSRWSRLARPVIAWDRHHGGERRRVLVSFATEPLQTWPHWSSPAGRAGRSWWPATGWVRAWCSRGVWPRPRRWSWLPARPLSRL